MRLSSVALLAVLVAAFAAVGCGDNLKLDLCPDDQPGCVTVGDGTSSEELDEIFNNAVDGQVIVLGPGRYDITAALQITANNVTLLGQGKDRTVLSFAGQTTGAQGILVTGDNFTARGFTIEDTAGDGLKLEGVDGVTLQSLRVTWTGGPSQDNGAYGLYPVLSKRVLIERCEVSNASDAGIYVGQSEDVIVRNNKVETNVAGIEIENCKRADVFDNRATNNTGGVLVFNLPGLTVGNGTQTRVFANELTANNFENFAPAGNIVGKIPPGTGVAVLAANAVEIFDNVVTDHLAAAVSVISFLPIDPSPDDPAFDSYPTAIHVHDNMVSGTASMPTGELGALLVLAVDEYSAPPIIVPDLIWDGVVDPVRGPGGIYPENLRICFENNGDADFLNINFPTGMGSPADQDASVVECTHPPLPAVAL